MKTMFGPVAPAGRGAAAVKARAARICFMGEPFHNPERSRTEAGGGWAVPTALLAHRNRFKGPLHRSGGHSPPDESPARSPFRTRVAAGALDVGLPPGVHQPRDHV